MLVRSLLVILIWCAVATDVLGRPVVKRDVDDFVKTVAHGLYKGHGTFFHPATEGGNIGSCGHKEDDNSAYCALNAIQYGDTGSHSDWCNKKLKIKYGDKTTSCIIADACPDCKPNSLDMTPKVFSQLADFKEGVIPIEWCIEGAKDC
ncbi:uncharacterized protein BYT42DRAFT_572565 [Radiomyces spectabilis]|uniref:uncharacterized protein n=1 Tax=Radiomyces spectabilis TaxID=64574 RepID=UPI00221F8DBB|nr:uncharacterized protein BYT42DRAFT_572565 [Radiomyces spectabilis]KAI8378056.1 hypothetical protein BYT42DRAFT_572565 [Radiomyces spectabilis]